MKLWNCVLAQYLAKCQRKDAIMLCWEKAPAKAHEQDTGRNPHGLANCRRSSAQGEICVHVSSIPRLFGALGTAPRRRVENEKWAATVPSRRGRRVSSSRNSSSAAAAEAAALTVTAMTAAIRSELIRERIIMCLQRRRNGNVAMPAFPGQSKVDVGEKAIGSCVERATDSVVC